MAGGGPACSEPRSFLARPSHDCDAHAVLSGTGLPEQVACRIAKQLPAGPFTRLPVEATDDRDWNAAQLAHHRFGGARHLVGEGEDRRLQHVAGRVALTEIVG